MRKSEPDDSNDDVFYSMSSAVSDTTLSASEVARSPTSSVGKQDLVNPLAPTVTKSKGFGKLRSLRPKKLLSKKYKAGDTSSDTTPESSTVLLPKMVDGNKKGGKELSKIPKKSRASNLVRRLTFGKRHKVVPKTGSLDEENSIKRQTPEGATGLSVSETSLCEIEEQSHEDSPIESERKTSGASGSSGGLRQELKIKITGKKIETIKKKYEGNYILEHDNARN